MARALVYGWRRSQIFQNCYRITKNREKEHFIKPISCLSPSQCREAHNTSNKSRSTDPQIKTQGQTKPYSPFESKILRLVRDEIQYQADYAPPHQVFLFLFWFSSTLVPCSMFGQWISELW